MKWEPYNKDPDFLCGVPEAADGDVGYRVLAVHNAPCTEVHGGYEHELMIERVAAGLNLLDRLQHTVGNPVFAIETNLGLLRKRIEAGSFGVDGQLDEALEIVDEIRKSLEKIKAAIKP